MASKRSLATTAGMRRYTDWGLNHGGVLPSYDLGGVGHRPSNLRVIITYAFGVCLVMRGVHSKLWRTAMIYSLGKVGNIQLLEKG